MNSQIPIFATQVCVKHITDPQSGLLLFCNQWRNDAARAPRAARPSKSMLVLHFFTSAFPHLATSCPRCAFLVIQL